MRQHRGAPSKKGGAGGLAAPCDRRNRGKGATIYGDFADPRFGVFPEERKIELRSSLLKKPPTSSRRRPAKTTDFIRWRSATAPPQPIGAHLISARFRGNGRAIRVGIFRLKSAELQAGVAASGQRHQTIFRQPKRGEPCRDCLPKTASCRGLDLSMDHASRGKCPPISPKSEDSGHPNLGSGNSAEIVGPSPRQRLAIVWANPFQTPRIRAVAR